MDSNYYHWMIDYLPRVRCITDMDDFKDFLFLTGDKLRPFQLETLGRAGISENRLLQIPARRMVECDELAITPIAVDDMSKEVAPDAIAWLRGLFQDSESSARTSKPRRIYLSRRDASCRRVLNEEDISALLHRYEFEIVTASNLTVAQQAALLRDAEIVVAPHGASLTNIVFCRPGTPVIEILPVGPKGKGAHYYQGLARSSGTNWRVVKVRPTNQDNDYHLDCGALEKAVNDALTTRLEA